MTDLFIPKTPYKTTIQNLVNNKNNEMEFEECHICMSRGINPLIECHVCHNKLCTMCCNMIKSPKFDSDVRDVDKCGVIACYKCPFCNTEEVDIPLSKLDKDDILQMIKIDYALFINLGRRHDKYKDELDELRMKFYKIDNINKKNDQNALIDYLIEENKKLKFLNSELLIYQEEHHKKSKELFILTNKIIDMENQHKKQIEKSKQLKDDYDRLLLYNNEIVKANNELVATNKEITDFLDISTVCNDDVFNKHKLICDIANNKALKPHQRIKNIVEFYKNTTFQRFKALMNEKTVKIDF